MPFRLTKSDDDRWQILDDADHILFSGTQPECEDWLDFQENEQRMIPGSHLIGWLRQFISDRSSKRGSTTAEPQQRVREVN